MKEIKLINRFSEKILNWANWTILGPKMAQPHNSGSTGRIFLKFCTMKGADRYMRIILVIVQKKLFGENGLFWVQISYIFRTLDPL